MKRLKLSKALTIPDTTTVADACRRMATRRVDAALLTDSNAILCGIITDKVCISCLCRTHRSSSIFRSHAIFHLLSNAEGKFLCIGMQTVEERQERITERQCLKWFFLVGCGNASCCGGSETGSDSSVEGDDKKPYFCGG